MLLMPSEPGWPKLLLQQVPEAKIVKNRMHLDIETLDIDAEAVAERLDKFVKMLSLVSDPALQGEIISAIKPHEALELAERIEAPDLRNALIRHSLASL